MSKLAEGKVAIVTGAGRGIGREHALLLAEQGAKVVVNDLGASPEGEGADLSPAQQVVAEIEAMGGEAVVNGADVSDFGQAKAMIDQAVETFGGLDILINNAGILRDRMIFSMTEQEWDIVTKVHLKGTFSPTHHASVYWRERSKAGDDVEATIINTASPSGIYGNVGQTNYGAAKAGIAAFTQIAAMELVRYGITVNCIAPGALTRLTAGLMGSAEPDEATQAAMSPRWIANVAVWLCGPDARNVTGRVFDVQGSQVAVAEGWHRGPTSQQTDEPTDLTPVMREILSAARLNADMGGVDAEGPGRPSKSL